MMIWTTKLIDGAFTCNGGPRLKEMQVAESSEVS